MTKSEEEFGISCGAKPLQMMTFNATNEAAFAM
jgi:hypothetical protein